MNQKQVVIGNSFQTKHLLLFHQVQMAFFMEVHDDVDNALSDASTQWPIDKLENILTSIIAFRKTYLDHG